MISIDLRKNSHLIVASSGAKTPVVTTMGSSISYYNASELLCMAYASCFGKHLHQYCRYNNINVESFERIEIDLDNFILTVNIQHPPLTKEQVIEIQKLTITCDIYKNFLKCKIIVNLFENEKPVEELVKKKTRRSCCGG